MARRLFGIMALLALSCAPAHQTLARDTNIAIYDNPSNNGSIAIDTDALSIKVDDGSFALEDCSSELLHCYINRETGFHIVFPKKCDPPSNLRGISAATSFIG